MYLGPCCGKKHYSSKMADFGTLRECQRNPVFSQVFAVDEVFILVSQCLESNTCTYTYIHRTYIHTYIHTCIHTYMHAYIHTYGYMDTYIMYIYYTISL
jgi:hypothetical protein